MKKMMTKSLMICGLLVFLAAPVLAANNSWIDPSDSSAPDPLIADTTGVQGPGIGADDLKFSSGVVFYYASDTANGEFFGLGTYNTKGAKAYMTNSQSSKLYGSVDEITPDTYKTAVSIPASGDPASSDWAEVGK